MKTGVENGKAPELKGFRFDETKKGPWYANLAPSGVCNARCLGCYATFGTITDLETLQFNRPQLGLRDWEEIIDKVAPSIQTIVFSGQGEITHPDVWSKNQQLINRALSKNLKVVMFTNGLTMDDKMADWIAEKEDLSVIGKWYDIDSKKNNRLMGMKDQEYLPHQGLLIPKHIKLLIDRGLAEDDRLAVGNTIYKQNMKAVPVMWRFLRENNIVPVFSWPVPEGSGKLAVNKFDLSDEEKNTLTRECWQIDQELGINWVFGLGPHISSTNCRDDMMLYIGPLGDIRICPSSHSDEPLGYTQDMTMEEMIATKLAKEAELGSIRAGAEGKATCACAQCALNTKNEN